MMRRASDREMNITGPADRSRGDTPVPPSGTRLFRVMTCNGELVIGLSCGQLACLGTTPMSRHTAGSWRRRLDRVGYLAVWQYDVDTTSSGRERARPLRQVPLFARDVLRLEHYDREVARDRLAMAA